MNTAEKKIAVKEAIEIAFGLFEDFFGDRVRNNVLLEGVEVDEETGNWCVTIGFQAGRVEETASTLGFGQVVKKPIREFRTFVLNGETGSFIKMENG